MPPTSSDTARRVAASRLAGCGVGLAAAAACTVVRAAVDPLLGDQAPFVVHILGVVVAAWFGGVLGGVSAVAASAAAVDYLFVEPRYAFTIANPDNVTRLVAFTLIGLALVWLGARWRRDERALRDAVAERDRVQEVLQRYEVLAQESRDVILFVGRPDGRIIEANEAAARTYGFSREELRQLTIHDLRGPDAARLTEAQMSEADETGILFETTHRRRDGTLFPVEVSSRGTRIGTERILLSIVRDITSKKRAADERERLYLEAREANRAKDEFLATLSHEMRTPLHAIQGWAQMLASGSLDSERQRQALAAILRSAASQARLVDEVLDLSRIVGRRFQLHRGAADVAAFVRRALDTVAPAADAKGVVISSSLPEGVVTEGDAERLQQVMWNLLSNAVKFTAPGGRVDVRAGVVDSRVEIRVSDTGIGISEEFRPRLFGRFSQADSSRTRRHGGLGLGLAIARHIVELHGGSITAASPGEGQGSTFTVLLPLNAVAGHAVPATSTRAEGARDETRGAGSLAGIRVLAVDDDPDSRQVLETMLASAGATVQVCASAREAIDALRRVRPNAIVSDIGMPDEDGYALIRKVRGLPADEGGGTPAVALTAYSQASDVVHALAAGYDRYLSKPVGAGDLVDAIVEAVRYRVTDPSDRPHLPGAST